MQVVEITITGTRRNIVIDESRPLGSGAAGEVLLIQGDSRSVVKIYHAKQDARKYEHKIKAMLQAPPAGLEIDVGGLKVPQFTWPTAMIYSGQGAFIGFKMARLDMSDYIDLEQLLQRKTRECEHLPESYLFRYTVARNLASAIEGLHRQEHFIVDLKPVNLLVHRQKPVVAVVDCDGFSIRVSGDHRYPAEQFTPDYLSPESHDKRPEVLGDAQDRFALSVVIFQLLNNGVHPYQFAIAKNAIGFPDSQPERIKKNLYAYGRHVKNGISPHPLSMHKFLEDDTLALFDRAFVGLPNGRPESSEWTTHLDVLVKQERIRSCARVPQQHFHFTKPCGLCAIDERRALAKSSQRPAVSQVASFRVSSSHAQVFPVPSTTSSQSQSTILQILKSIFEIAVQLGSYIFLVLKLLFVWTSVKLRSGEKSDYAQLALMYGGLFGIFIWAQSAYRDFSIEKVWPGWTQSSGGKAVAAVPTGKSPTTTTGSGHAINTSVSGRFYVLRNSNVRSGPGPKFDVVTTLDANAEVYVLGKSPETGWYQIAMPFPVKIYGDGPARQPVGFISDKLVTAAANCRTVTSFEESISSWQSHKSSGGASGSSCEQNEKLHRNRCPVEEQRNVQVSYEHTQANGNPLCRVNAAYECPVKMKVRKEQRVCAS